MTYGLWERIHGHLALIALILVLHPVVTLPADRVWTRRTAILAALALGVPFALGGWIYPEYGAEVKPGLHPFLRAGFEVKEHLAALALAAVGSGAVAAQGGDDARKLARHLLFAGWCCGFIAGLLGLWVAGRP